MTAGTFSEHLDDCEALMCLVEECLTGPPQCYYCCNGTVGGQRPLIIHTLSFPYISSAVTIFYLPPLLTHLKSDSMNSLFVIFL